ncbi:hypothetical protein F4823DRAFT_598598 [Ustulina deusta]|nr:hypothetical protein F4823DRAFT_598598 [Ustulina deusta]
MSRCASGWSLCSEAGLPSNFCCESARTYIVVANNTTVLCCPQDSDCSIIRTIACDLCLQNPAIHPQAAIKTTATTDVRI